MVRLSWIDQLVESGLCPRKKLPYARIVMSDVPQGIKSMVYRELAIDIFSKITNMILNDQVLYQRLRQLLAQQHHEEIGDVLDILAGEALHEIGINDLGQSTLKTIKKVVRK